MRGVTGLVCAVSVRMVGCQKSPFYNDYPRTPYERYQLLRGQDAPVQEFDTYGNPRPALRQRLTPPEQR